MCGSTIDWTEAPEAEPPPNDSTAKIDEAIDYGAGVGAAIGGAVGAVAGVGLATAGLLLAFSSENVLPMLAAFGALPIAPIAGAAIGASIGGERESRALAGGLGGAAGVAITGIGFFVAYSAGALPIPDDVKPTAFVAIASLGGVVAIASCGAVAATASALLE